MSCHKRTIISESAFLMGDYNINNLNVTQEAQFLTNNFLIFSHHIITTN